MTEPYPEPTEPIPYDPENPVYTDPLTPVPEPEREHLTAEEAIQRQADADAAAAQAAADAAAAASPGEPQMVIDYKQQAGLP